MRAWGRPMNSDGTRGAWTVVETDANGNNDMVYVTALCQCLLLNLNESPMYANYGIPAQPTIASQIYPDYYVVYTQTLFAPYFASLIISRVPTFEPTYNINVVTHQGIKLNINLPVPY